MAVVIDSSVLIDALRDRHGAVEFLAQARRDGPLHSSVVVRTELLSGMRAAEREATEQLLGTLRWHAVTIPLADEAGRLGRRWLASHSGIGVADLIIAATALALELPLATSNVRHFPMFEGLRPPY